MVPLSCSKQCAVATKLSATLNLTALRTSAEYSQNFYNSSIYMYRQMLNGAIPIYFVCELLRDICCKSYGLSFCARRKIFSSDNFAN